MRGQFNSSAQTTKSPTDFKDDDVHYMQFEKKKKSSFHSDTREIPFSII